MSETLKAIETLYAGCRFRSRLEARWAVFFDHLGIRWAYEPQGFVGHNDERYLPDFYLPEVSHRYGELPQSVAESGLAAGHTVSENVVGIYAEVKGSDEALRADGRRIGSMIDYHATPISQAGLLILGDIPRGDAWSTMHSFLHWWKGVAHILVRFDRDYRQPEGIRLTGAPYPYQNFGDGGTDADVPDDASTLPTELERPTYRRGSQQFWWNKSPFQEKVDQAYQAARSARFEHGESGAPPVRAALGARARRIER